MQINDDEIIAALNRSGYFLESRVLEVLAQNGYKNFPNQTYPDSITEKSREIDIYSEAPRITENISINQHLHFEYQFRLVIECINNIQPVAFFKRPDKDSHSIFGKFYYCKMERELVEKYKGTPPDFQFNTYTTKSKHFHYNQIPKNTQYCSFSLKKGSKKEWMASHPDALHDTFSKLMDFSQYDIRKIGEWMPRSAWRDEVFTVMLFPLLVLQNDLIEVSENEGKIEIEKKKHIIFDFKKHSDSKNGLLIDVITEDFLPEYLKRVEVSMTELKDEMVCFYTQREIVEKDPKK
ncbi:hypothetical protein [Flagellimonas flava]|uniref:hypothetical protein n=1 Tax=Flagellimonas flava TaxID=570519 RepID=UPI003D653BA0